MRTEPSQAIDQIREKYGSLDQPSFEFAARCYREKPYRRLVDDLLLIGYVHDATDLNDDVCFVFDIRVGKVDFRLELSFVGPYCVLLKTGQGLPDFVDHRETAFPEKRILEILSAHGFEILPESLLESLLPMRMPWAPDEAVTFYQALFTAERLVTRSSGVS